MLWGGGEGEGEEEKLNGVKNKKLNGVKTSLTLGLTSHALRVLRQSR